MFLLPSTGPAVVLYEVRRYRFTGHAFPAIFGP